MRLDVPLPREKQLVVVWQTADFVEPDEPAFAHDWEVLLAQAETSLATRRKAYPDWIARGQIAQADADADIAAWEWLVAEWRWIISGEGTPPPADTLAGRRAAVELSLQRIEAELHRGHRTEAIHRQAHIALALAWHLETVRFGAPMIHGVAERNHARSRDRAARSPQHERSAA